MTVAEALAAVAIDWREARILLAAASGLSEAAVTAYPERALPDAVAQRYVQLAERRARGEPVAYLLGQKEFYGLELIVNPAVLVPRPETELLVELALERRFDRALDLGTGSGAIALALKRHRPQAAVVALDASSAALVVARRNAAKHALAVDFRQGRWFEPVRGERFSLIVSNPPYVAEGDAHLADLRFEPREALVAGPDGLAAIRDIARSAPAHLEKGGALFLEHGHGQDEAVRRLLEAAGFEAVASWPDLAGIPRVTGGKLE